MSHRRFACLPWLAILAACGGGAEPASDAGLSGADGGTDGGAPTVMAQTESGPVLGKTVGGGVLAFRGIPFAAPPLGALRFAPPAPHDAWTEPLDATGDGTQCYQREMLTNTLAGDEDCLHVNVWTPSLEGARPVMVWIHGGGFVSGSGSDALIDSWRVAAEGDVVVVTLNYRLGAFGFLAHSSLAAADEPNGNWGVLDQQAAVRWARDNAAHFGGDPSNVTVFGHSAGGISTCLMALSPTAAGLAQHFVDQSGPCAVSLHPLAEASALGDRVATALACTGDTARCLRSADREALLDALDLPVLPGGPLYQEITFPYRPTLDGVTFVEQPFEALRAGRLADATYVFGATTDEGTFFHHPLAATPVANEAEMRAALERLPSIVAITPAQVSEILASYPVASYASANDALQASTTDMFICAMRYSARLTNAAGRETYLYHFAQEPARVTVSGLGVYHGADVVFLFGNRSSFGGAPTSAPDLGPAMRGYWTRYARTGDPAGTPTWPEWTPAADQRLRLAETIVTEAGDPDGRCALWDGILDTL